MLRPSPEGPHQEAHKWSHAAAPAPKEQKHTPPSDTRRGGDRMLRQSSRGLRHKAHEWSPAAASAPQEKNERREGAQKRRPRSNKAGVDPSFRQHAVSMAKCTPRLHEMSAVECREQLLKPLDALPVTQIGGGGGWRGGVHVKHTATHAMHAQNMWVRVYRLRSRGACSLACRTCHNICSLTNCHTNSRTRPCRMDRTQTLTHLLLCTLTLDVHTHSRCAHSLLPIFYCRRLARRR